MNPAIYIEMSQSLVPMAALDDSGDHKRFYSDDHLWSAKSGFSPTVRPNGIATGGKASPGAGDNQIAIAAMTCFSQGGPGFCGGQRRPDCAQALNQ